MPAADRLVQVSWCVQYGVCIAAEVQRKGGLVACSSGNHAQGVAEAARLLGMKSVIVMPSDAPAIKVARTRRSGAEVVLYDRAKGGP